MVLAHPAAIARGKIRVERIDAQHLAKDNGEILGVPDSVVMARSDVISITAIAISEIEVVVIRPEKEMAGVMIELRVIDPSFS